jgi:hypothetical protein
VRRADYWPRPWRQGGSRHRGHFDLAGARVRVREAVVVEVSAVTSDAPRRARRSLVGAEVLSQVSGFGVAARWPRFRPSGVLQCGEHEDDRAHLVITGDTVVRSRTTPVHYSATSKPGDHGRVNHQRRTDRGGSRGARFRSRTRARVRGVGPRGPAGRDGRIQASPGPRRNRDPGSGRADTPKRA